MIKLDKKNKCFVTTVRGLEQHVVEELTKLGATDLKIHNAGVSFLASYENIIRINLQARLISRVLVELASGAYSSESDIYKLASDIAWEKLFNVSRTIKVSTTAIKCPLKSLDFVTLRVKDAICDRFNKKFDQRPSVDKSAPDIRVYLFLDEVEQTIYIDTSGEALFKRGYRDTKLEAPLKENLAAGLLTIAAYDGTTALYDPMCGSGTIAIEAAMIALNIAPGLHREFAFEKLIVFPEQFYHKLKAELISAQRLDRKIEIYASDINHRAIEVARENAFKAGVLDYVSINRKDFFATQKPADSGMIVTNLPYGVRLEDQEALDELYPKIGDYIKKNYSGWDTYWLSSDLTFAKKVGLTPKRKTPVFNGPLECRLFYIDVISGSNRRVKVAQ